MSTNADQIPGRAGTSWDAAKRHDERVFRVIFLFTFPFFLVVALLARVLPAATADGASAKRGNVFSQASATARSTIAVALMN